MLAALLVLAVSSIGGGQSWRTSWNSSGTIDMIFRQSQPSEKDIRSAQLILSAVPCRADLGLVVPRPMHTVRSAWILANSDWRISL
jgi:hypothetical protein